MAEPKKIKTRIINKHATAAVWEATQEKFTPLEGELIVYDKDDTYSAPRLKIGTGSENVNNLNFISKGMVDGSSLTYDNDTGKISLSEEYKTYLDNQLYQPPTISAFDIVKVSTAEVTDSAISISSFTHTETNIDNIVGTLTLKRQRKSGNTIIESDTIIKSDISASSTSTSVTITDSYTPNKAQTVTYTLSGVNTKGTTFNKTDSVTYYCPHYYGALDASSLTNKSDIKQLGLTKHSSTNTNWTGTINITTKANQHVYFVTTDSAVTITSGGFGVPVTKQTYTFLVNGSEQTYYAYRTDAVQAGDNTFVLS